jgi:hypothetical protein
MKQAPRDPLLTTLAVLILGWLAVQSGMLSSALSRLAVVEDRLGIARPRPLAHQPVPRDQTWAMPSPFSFLEPTPWCPTPKEQK